MATGDKPVVQPRALRLLIVEDNRRDAELMAAALKRAGYTLAYEWVNSLQAFQEALANDFDVVLCDHNLGSWTGMEALALLRKERKFTSFIVVTGTIGEEAAVEYMKQGADGYVLKNRLERLPLVLHRAFIEKAKLEENSRLQEAILIAKRDWELTFDAVTDAVMMLDTQGVVRRANRATVELLKLDFSQLLGRSHNEVFHRTDDSRSQCAFQLMMQTGLQQRIDLPQPWLNKIFDVVASPIRDASGNLAGGTLVMRDISERQKMNEQLRHAQKMEAVGRLAGGIAHDFNNLLNVILGNAEILKSERFLNPPEQRRLDEINKAVRRAAQLTSQLLAFSRRQVLYTRVLDLNALILETEDMLQRLMGEDIKILTDLQPSLGMIRADQAQLEQILMNLATNARDAMPDGGTIVIRTADAELGPDQAAIHPYIKQGRFVHLSVADTGTGMTPEVIAQVFEPFFTTKEKGRGSGLGLAVAYGVVKQSGGYIWVTSEPGHGACFDIYLPRVEAKAVPVVKRPDSEASVPGGTETVLVVEDDEAVLLVLRHFLVQAGYSVLGAGTPTDALDIAERHKQTIALAIVDTVLPEMNGPAVACAISKLHPETKLLYMSGYVDRPVLAQFKDSGSNFLQKPISREILLNKVHELLHRPEVEAKVANA